MNRYWILIADAAQAKLFAKANRTKPLELIEAFEHPQSREKRQALTSDRPGHYQSKGTGHGALVDASDPKIYQAEQFAKQLAVTLNEGYLNKSFRELVLAAPPKFYGMLNKHISKQVSANIATVLAKDYTQTPDRELSSIINATIIS